MPHAPLSATSDADARLGTQKTKVVVRHLPPNLPEAVFWETLGPAGCIDGVGAVDWRAFYPGKVRTSLAKENRLAYAYIAFKSPAAALEFARVFHHHVFVESQTGREYVALVEPAPFRRIPKRVVKVDYKQGTLDSDPMYIEFLAKYRILKDSGKDPNMEAEIEKMKLEATPTINADRKTTPLIQHLRAIKTPKVYVKKVADAQAQAKRAKAQAKANRKAVRAKEREERRVARREATAKAEKPKVAMAVPSKPAAANNGLSSAKGRVESVRLLQRPKDSDSPGPRFKLQKPGTATQPSTALKNPPSFKASPKPKPPLKNSMPDDKPVSVPGNQPQSSARGGRGRGQGRGGADSGGRGRGSGNRGRGQRGKPQATRGRGS